MTVLQFDHYWNIQNNLIDSQEADEIDAEKIFIFLQVKHMYSDWVGFFLSPGICNMLYSLCLVAWLRVSDVAFTSIA